MLNQDKMFSDVWKPLKFTFSCKVDVSPTFVNLAIAFLTKSFDAKTNKTLFFEGIEPSKKQGKKTARNQNVFVANEIMS